MNACMLDQIHIEMCLIIKSDSLWANYLCCILCDDNEGLSYSTQCIINIKEYIKSSKCQMIMCFKLYDLEQMRMSIHPTLDQFLKIFQNV